MKYLKHFTLLISFLVIWSCENDQSGDNVIIPDSETGIFISATKVDALDKVSIITFLQFAAYQLPGQPDLASEVVSGVNVYEVRYRAPYINDTEIELSGLVCIPDDESIESLMISFQNGTIVTHGSAPTKDLNDPEKRLLHSIAGMGYVVLIPDYIGFGSSEDKFHPYHYKPLFQTTVYNFIKAVKEMADSDEFSFKLSGDLFLTGYSLGGWATLVTHNYLELNPVEGLSLSGSACG